MSCQLSAQDEYGFLRGADFDFPGQEEFLSSYLGVLARRGQKWEALLGQGASYEKLKRGNQLKRFVRKGIPSSHRKGVWMEVSGASQLRKQQPGLYPAMLKASPASQMIVGQIETDLPRTFPNNTHFDSTKPDNMQRNLYNVLLAFSNSNQTIGYCQGLNYIAGLLLLVTKEEDATFWLLKTLLEQKLPDYYTASMPGLLTDLKVLEELAFTELSGLANHIKQLGVPWPLFASKWFICLYCEVLPIETVLRVWDAVFYEGSKILFRVALGILKIHQESLLKCKDFASLVEQLKEAVVSRSAIHCHQFLEEVFEKTGALPRSKIERLREEKGREVKKEQKEREERRKEGGLKEG